MAIKVKDALAHYAPEERPEGIGGPAEGPPRL